MTVQSYILGIIAALFVLVVVIELLRRGRLRERHAVWWLLAGVLALIVGIFPAILEWTADLVGVQVPTNLVFFVSIAILFLVCLQYAAELTRLESHTRTLAERVALLEERLNGAAGSTTPEASDDLSRDRVRSGKSEVVGEKRQAMAESSGLTTARARDKGGTPI